MGALHGRRELGGHGSRDARDPGALDLRDPLRFGGPALTLVLRVLRHRPSIRVAPEVGARLEAYARSSSRVRGRHVTPWGSGVEPPVEVADRLVERPRAMAQLGLGATSDDARVARERMERLGREQVGGAGRPDRGARRRPSAGQPHRRRPARHRDPRLALRDVPELADARPVAGQEVALAGAAALGGRDEGERDVAHVHPVERPVDEGRQATVAQGEEEPAHPRGLEVARADDPGRVHDDGIEATRHDAPQLRLTGGLRAVVRGQARPRAARGRLVHRASGRRREVEGVHRAAVHEPSDAGATSRVGDVPHPRHVRRPDPAVRIAGDGDAGRQVEDDVDPRERVAEPVRVEDARLDVLDVDAVERGAAADVDRPDALPALDEEPDEVRADVPRRARDGDVPEIHAGTVGRRLRLGKRHPSHVAPPRGRAAAAVAQAIVARTTSPAAGPARTTTAPSGPQIAEHPAVRS